MMNLMNVSMIDFVTVVDKTLSDDNYTLLNVTTTDDNSIVVLNVQKDDIKFYVPCVFESDNVLSIITTIRQSLVNYYSVIALNILTNNYVSYAA